MSCTIKALVSCTIKALVSFTSSVRCNSGSRFGGRFPVSVTAHVLCIKLLSTGACANINIREIMLTSIISSASWTLQKEEEEEAAEKEEEEETETERDRERQRQRQRQKHRQTQTDTDTDKDEKTQNLI